MYEELVKQLRTAKTVSVAWKGLLVDAAAAIEALQAEVAELKRVNMEIFEDLPKRGKWTWIQRANGGHYKGCSVCHAPMPTDSMLDYLDDEDCEFCYSCGAKMGVQDD